MFVYLYSDDGTLGAGTGFIGHILNKNLLVLLTCHHVIPTKEVAKVASFTFGYKDDSNQGTTVAADDLLDVAQWWTDTSPTETLVKMCSSYIIVYILMCPDHYEKNIAEIMCI